MDHTKSLKNVVEKLIQGVDKRTFGRDVTKDTWQWQNLISINRVYKHGVLALVVV